MFHRIAARPLLALGCAALLATALAASGAAWAGDEVPFKGSGTATFQGHDPTTKTSYFTLDGTGTHLGRLSGDAYVLFEYEPVPHPVSAVVTMVAADGSEVVLATVQATQSYTIVDGTGRFEGATGSGVFVAVGAGDVSLEWDGTIDFKD